MEITFDNSNIIPPRLSLEKVRLNKNIQTKNSYRTEANITSSEKNPSAPVSTDSKIINTFSLNELIANKNKPTKISDKKKRKGILHKYIGSSYFKKSFGSIPNKSEKILIPNIKIVDRFSGPNSLFNQENENTPGVGSYDLKYDWNLKNKSVKMESEEKRFSDFYNFLPGIGDYNPDNGQKKII